MGISISTFPIICASVTFHIVCFTLCFLTHNTYGFFDSRSGVGLTQAQLAALLRVKDSHSKGFVEFDKSSYEAFTR